MPIHIFMISRVEILHISTKKCWQLLYVTKSENYLNHYQIHSTGYTTYYHSSNTSLSLQGMKTEQCCPMCESVSCSDNCLTCEDSNSQLTPITSAFSLSVIPENSFYNSDSAAAICTACKIGYMLQKGVCVVDCSEEFFSRDGICIKCHESCSRCSEQTNFHCTR